MKIDFVQLDMIEPSPFQTRHFNGSPDLEELAASIRSVGVLQPVLLRPLEGGKYELMAGERRTRAAQLAELTGIPAIIKEATDAEACEICITENFEREDLSIMEEARGVDLMLSYMTQEEAAAKLGRSVTFVARRAHLVNLTEEWQESEWINEWPVGHLEAIAILRPEDQNVVLDSLSEWDKRMNKEALNRRIQGLTHKLSAAKWDLDDDMLIAEVGACSACPDRSSANPSLFGEKPSEDFCLGHSCWNRKLVAYVAGERAKLEEGEIEHILLTSKWDGEEGIRARDIEGLQKKRMKGGTRALMLDGPEAGRTFWFKKEDQKRVTEKGLPVADGEKKGPITMEEKRERLRRRRYKVALQNFAEALEKSKRPGVANLLAITLGVGTKSNNDWLETRPKMYPGSSIAIPSLLGIIEGMKDKEHKEAYLSVLWTDMLVPVLMKRIKYSSQLNIDLAWNECEVIGSLIGINTEKMLDEAIGSIAEPKAWSN